MYRENVGWLAKAGSIYGGEYLNRLKWQKGPKGETKSQLYQ